MLCLDGQKSLVLVGTQPGEGLAQKLAEGQAIMVLPREPQSEGRARRL